MTLVVLAAGIGSRYGGLKQIESFGPNGERILDYSVYDALRAGFTRVVFVIRDEIAKDFREAFGARFERHMEVAYVMQSLDALPPAFRVPGTRTKPWGTGHAVLVARELVSGPFAVINADDFYGPKGYARLAQFLRDADNAPDTYALVAYRLERTLSDAGSVARGVCRLDESGMLASITEFTQITRLANDITATLENGASRRLDASTPVSMNFWGFAPSLFEHLETGFAHFLDERGDDDRAEFYLPTAVDALLRTGAARVRVLDTPDAWLGVTYPRDRDAVAAGLQARMTAGQYRSPLWI